MKSVQVITLGCSKNTVDTQHLLAQLPPERFTVLPEDWTGDVDYLLVNTCGFIGDAKEESIQVLLEQARRRQSGRAGKLFAFGCLSQRYSSELPALIPEVDGWFGARDLGPIVEAVGAHPSEALSTVRYGAAGSYAYLKISEGCDRRCSYCAIPYIRGAHRSVPIEKIVEEARGLAARGVRELILIAQDTTFYGLDLYGRRRLADVLRALSEIPEIEWIRVHYSYPEGFPEDVLRELADNPKVCRYMDIPLQHISDRVLDNMHRHVDGAWTRALIKRLRDEVPGVALRTTVIVGHPGEGPEEFRELLDFVKEARFERLGAFMYSEEEGTWGAAHLRDDVPPEEKQRRYDALMQLQQGISAAYNESRVGKCCKVLVDSVMDGCLIARSEFESPEVDGEIIVSVPAGWSESASPANPSGPAAPDAPDLRSFVGRFVNVRITEALDYDLRAELL